MQQKVDMMVEMLSGNELAETQTPQSTHTIHIDHTNSGYLDLGHDIAMKLWDRRWQDESAELSQADRRDLYQPDLSAVRAITDSLQFDDSEKRHEDIPEVHANTLRWVWRQQPPLLGDRPQWSSFPAWLEANDAPFYSIIGKPGSGKSTLIKYIQHHPNLEAH